MLLAFACCGARAQVLEDLSLDHEIKKADDLLAGTRRDDLPHQLHYDLKLTDLRGEITQATYDIYRDETKARVDMAAPNYHFTRIVLNEGKTVWTKETGLEPVRLFDFQAVLLGPQAALSRLKPQLPPLAREVVEGTPYLCAGDGAGTVACFDPLLHTYAFAQTINQTVTYDTWLKIGLRYVPGHIQIFNGKHPLLEANGTLLPASNFPAGLFKIPAEPGNSEKQEHSVVKEGSVSAFTKRDFGCVSMNVSVDLKGRVDKVEIVDSDDKDLEGAARHFAKTTVYAPYLVDGQPQPFETSLWFRQYPAAE